MKGAHDVTERKDQQQPEARADELTGTDADDTRALSEVVDDIEDKVTKERRAEGAPGNVEERAATPPVEPDSNAPD